MPPPDPAKHAAWLREEYSDASAPPRARHATKDAVGICDSDALAGRRARAVTLDDRLHIVLGALAGDAVGVTSHGLPHARAAKLCHDFVPWPWQAHGNLALNLPAKAVSVLGAQLLATLRAFERSIGRDQTHEELAATGGMLTDFEAALDADHVIRPPIETWLDADELAAELCVWYTDLHGASTVVDTKTLYSVGQLYERRRPHRRIPRPPPAGGGSTRRPSPPSTCDGSDGGCTTSDASSTTRRLQQGLYPYTRRASRGGAVEYVPPDLRARRAKYYDDVITGRPAEARAGGEAAQTARGVAADAAAEAGAPPAHAADTDPADESFLLRRARLRRKQGIPEAEDSAHIPWSGGLREGHTDRVGEVRQRVTAAAAAAAARAEREATGRDAPVDDGGGRFGWEMDAPVSGRTPGAALVSGRAHELSKSGGEVIADTEASTVDPCDPYRHHTSVFAPLMSDYDVSPTTTSGGCLARNMAVAAVSRDKRLAITASVAACLITHSHPVEVLACVVHTVLLFDALHFDHKPDVADGAYYEALLLSGDRKASAWQQWKEEVVHPHCKAWLAAVGAEGLARYEREVVDALADICTYNPFAPPAANKTFTEGDKYAVLRTLKIALWALHRSVVGGFPEGLVDTWTRREDYVVPVKYRTRIEKERKMVLAGLIPAVPRDYPGGAMWTVLDCCGGFDAMVWVPVLGAEAVANSMVAGSLLGAWHGVPGRWGDQVGIKRWTRELVKRAVGGEAELEGARQPEWLVAVSPDTAPRERLARMVNFHLRTYLQKNPPSLSARPTEDEAAETMARACLALHAHPDAFAELHRSEFHPRLRAYTARRPDFDTTPAPDDFAARCRVVCGDPMEIYAEMAARGRNALIVYLADPGELCGQYLSDTDANDEGQLLKRTTAWLNLYTRREREDERMHAEIATRLPARDPAYPLPSTGVVYLPTIVICRDQTYRWLPVTRRVCASAALMAHHRKDPWETSEIAIIRRRMEHVLEVAARHGHDAVILPSFGYKYIKQLMEDAIQALWMEKAAAYSHVFQEVVVTTARAVPTELKRGHVEEGAEARIC